MGRLPHINRCHVVSGPSPLGRSPRLTPDIELRGGLPQRANVVTGSRQCVAVSSTSDLEAWSYIAPQRCTINVIVPRPPIALSRNVMGLYTQSSGFIIASPFIDSDKSHRTAIDKFLAECPIPYFLLPRTHASFGLGSTGDEPYHPFRKNIEDHSRL